MTEENSIQLLWNCANALDAGTHTKRLLKSYYINTSRDIAKYKTQLPNKHYGVSEICPHCSSQWSSSEFQLRLKPQRVINNAKARKLITKLEQPKTSQNVGLLTRSQRKRAKWLKKRVTSNMEITCGFCEHKILIPLIKPKKHLETIVTPVVPNSVIAGNKKKKKKHKDISADLHITTLQTTKTDQKVKPQINAATKSKQKKQKHNSKQKPSTATTNIQSKTQKKNSILQLATLLKTQADKTAANMHQNRLDLLLQ